MNNDSDKDVFISYIIPCYNVAKYLPNCLESLSRQKIKEGARIEYILVNDGSKDGTLQVLEEFASHDERAIVIDQKNQGVCAARNNGLRQAKGKYVYFHDGDDILTDEASQLVYDESIEKEPDIIIPNAYSVKDDELNTKYDWNTFPGFNSGVYATQEFVSLIDRLPICVKVYKRETLIKNNILFDEDLLVGEVYTFFFHVLAYSNFVTLIDGRMMIWVVRSAGTTKGYSIERDSQIINTMHRIDEYAQCFTFDVKSYRAYHESLFGIINTFSIGKYPFISEFTPEIGEFLAKIRNEKVYQDTLRFYLFKKPRLGRKYLNIAILYFLPIRVYYMIHRIGLKNKLKAILGKCQGTG